MPGEKTEKPTSKRKGEARKKGNVFQSREVPLIVTLVLAFYLLQFFGSEIMEYFKKAIYIYFGMIAEKEIITVSDLQIFYINGCIIFAKCVLPLMLILGAISVIITLAQTRMLVVFSLAKPKLNRLSPLAGIKKLFSARGIVELLKSLLKIILLGAVLFNVYLSRFPEMPRLMDMSIGQAITYTGDMIMDIVKTGAVVFALIAIFDYFYQRWKHQKDLMMSKEDIKEEYKQAEGDPKIKSRIRGKQREQARKRMMQAVVNADVVIRNPTHYAVAIQYNPEKNNAPVVIAKGVDKVALKIVEIAKENDIVITENKPLARGLYAAVELDMEIPSEFYQPVAEVLAFVYSLKKKELK